jgi:starch synthase
MIKRIYFLTSEIVPFAESYQLADFSKEIPIIFNERKFDFRLMMPKYSFISERRYILREVIRLREMDLRYRNESLQASVKSAFIPNTKVQVYFLEQDEYYSNSIPDLYREEPEADTGRNAIRFGYFAAAALTTLNYLRWRPDVIICNDWQMGMIPLMIHSNILDKTYFDGVKILQVLHSKNPLSKYLLADYQSVGISDLNQDLVEKGKRLVCVAAAWQFSHHTLFISNQEDLLKRYQTDPIFAKLIEGNKKRISTFKVKSDTPEEWQRLANEIVRIVERI